MSIRRDSALCRVWAVALLLSTPGWAVGQTADPTNMLPLALQQNRVPPSAAGRFPPKAATRIKAQLPVRRLPGGHFRIQVSQTNPILTPAVSGPAILVGDGFTGSRLYCIDSRTLKVAWCYRLSDPGPSSVTCASGTAVVNTESCTTYAFDIASGRPIWSAWLGDPLVGTPTIARGRVFTSYPTRSYAGIPGRGAAPNLQTTTPTEFAFVSLDLKTGRPLWQRWVDQHVVSAPAVVGDHVVATTFGGTLYAFRAADGKISMARKIRATSVPVFANDILFFSCRGDQGGSLGVEEKITAMDVLTGKELFSIPHTSVRVESHKLPDVRQMQQYSGNRPLLTQNALYCGLGGKLLRIGPTTGEIEWSVDLTPGEEARLDPAAEERQPLYQPTTPVVMAADELIVATRSGKILRIDPEDGDILHTYDAGAPILSEPIVTSGYILAGTATGELIGINTGNPNLTGRHQLGNNAAGVRNEKVGMKRVNERMKRCQRRS